MAKFIGNAGEFQKERAINRRVNALAWGVIGFCLIFFVIGLATMKVSPWSLLALIVVFPGYKVIEKLLDRQIRLSRMDEDGADGEREIIPYLRRLPDSYTVISDLDFAESYGNIDHLVIGPTGMFALDVKNWSGTVSADGKGELLQNGQPTGKPHVSRFTSRVMELKKRLTALTKLDPYIQGVFVFPHTRVEAKWSTTGHVDCVRVHNLAEYILNGRHSIPPDNIARLVKAAEALKNAVN